MSDRKWSKQKIIDEIKKLHEAGEPLNDSYVNVHHKALYSSAISERYFGRWRNAITAAGFEYDKLNLYADREKWSKEKIIDTILELHKRGEDLSVSNVGKNHDPLLMAACKKNYFGSWKNAIVAAGLEYDEIIKYEFWSKEKIISRILELRKAGKDLSSRNMQKNYGSVFSSAFNYFGTWENAIIAAGLNYEKIRKQGTWDKDKIIGRIRELYEAGEPLNDSYVNEYHNPLRAAAIEKRYFGSWRNAVAAAGLDYDEIRLDSDKEAWSKQKIIDRIIELNQNRENLNSHYMKSNHSTLYWAACRAKYFGSWENAIIATGLEYEKIRKDADLEQWDKQKIIDRILDMYTEGEDLSARYISMQHAALYSAACVNKYFGSWRNAIATAGLDYDKIIKLEFWSKEKIINKILESYEKGGDLNSLYVQKHYVALYGAACRERFFGSWENAIEAAGLNYDEIRKQETWDKNKIIDRIQELHEAGEPMNHSYVHKYYNSLLAAAVEKRYFGSWKNAITEAGLDYDEIIKVEFWSKEKIIERILEVHEAGENLSATYLRNHRKALYGAACSDRYFGSWKNAITIAGLDYEKIRMDHKTESYKGFLLEKYLKEIFKACGKKVYAQKRFKFEEEACIPDFVDKDSGLWMDCKLRSWSFGIENTAQKYLKYVGRLVVYYLIGEPRKWYKDKVVFKCIKSFYPQLKELGRDDIIQELSLLERGVIPSKYQKDLDDFWRMEESREHITSIED